MADDNSEKVVKYGFLYEKKAEGIFAKLDYTLRSGIHGKNGQIDHHFPV